MHIKRFPRTSIVLFRSSSKSNIKRGFAAWDTEFSGKRMSVVQIDEGSTNSDAGTNNDFLSNAMKIFYIALGSSIFTHSLDRNNKRISTALMASTFILYKL
jgi:hypothetical protein